MENCALFVATLLHSATNTHFFHWSTDSYAKHIALGEYYDGIVELTDSVCRSLHGQIRQVHDIPKRVPPT
jgi:hypothetical protein